MRRTREDAEQTREAILDAAERVFYDRGVAGGTLEEIARVAGVTRGAVYWHFTNKLHIFEALSARAILPHDEAMRQLEQAGDTDRLGALERCIVATFVDAGTDEAVRVRLTVQLLRCDYVGEMAPALQGHAALIHRMTARFTAFFSDLPPPPARVGDWQPEVVGTALASLLHGTLTLWLRSPEEFPLATVGARNVRLFIASLRLCWWTESDLI